MNVEHRIENKHGALLNWKKLQEEFQCFYFIADWHALTSDYANTEIIKESTYDIIMDWISVGLDPEQSTFFIQSDIKEHAELYLLFSMLTPLPWLERNPTYKEQLKELSHKDIFTYGFLGYPVLQAADILMYKAIGVPVGEDQAPHVELTREIARRFNHIYSDIFPVPNGHEKQTREIQGSVTFFPSMKSTPTKTPAKKLRKGANRLKSGVSNVKKSWPKASRKDSLP